MSEYDEDDHKELNMEDVTMTEQEKESALLAGVALVVLLGLMAFGPAVVAWVLR